MGFYRIYFILYCFSFFLGQDQTIRQLLLYFIELMHTLLKNGSIHKMHRAIICHVPMIQLISVSMYRF